MPDFYEALKQERTKRHLTQEEMANLLGVKRSTYSLYESGKRMPKTDTLDKIVEALDVLIYYDHEAHQYQFITFEDGQTQAYALFHSLLRYDWLLRKEQETTAVPLRGILGAYKKLNDDGRKESVKRIEALNHLPLYAKPDEP